MNSMKRQKGMVWKDEIPRLVSAQYATGEEQRNSFRRNEEVKSKQKQWSVVDVSGGKVESDSIKNNIALEPVCART